MAREWYPADLVDETMPDGKPTPDAWLEPPAGGVTCIFNPDDEAIPLHELLPGDEVGFQWFEQGGTITIHVMPDGSFTDQSSVTAAGLRKATTFWLWEEPEICGDTLEEFARVYAESAEVELVGHSIDVSLGTWSDSIPFRLLPNGRSLLQVIEEVPATSNQEHGND